MRPILLVVMLLLSTGLKALEPQLRCERAWGEITWEGMEFHRYKLRAEHFPPKRQFVLVVQSFDGKQTEAFTYHSNNKGHLILQPPENIEGDIYAICPAKRGERLTFIMRANDCAYSTDVIPFPLEVISKKGLRLNLELKGENGEKFFLGVKGLRANEKVELICEAGEQSFPVEVSQATPLGELYTFITLPEQGEGGKAHLLLKRKKEEILFPFEWGEPALKIVGACCFEIK